MATAQQFKPWQQIGGSMESFEKEEYDSVREEPKDKGLSFGTVIFDSKPMTGPTSAPDHGGHTIKPDALMNAAWDTLYRPEVAKVTAHAATEVGGAVGSLIIQDFLGLQGKKAEGGHGSHHTTENNAKKQRENEIKAWIQSRIQEQQRDQQAVRAQDQQKVQEVLIKTGLSVQEVMGDNKGGANQSYEGVLTINAIFFAVAKRAKNAAQAVRNTIAPPRGKAKAGQSLQMHSGAQEGQSLVSSSGAVTSAG
jgi:hypothetical protein